MPRAEARIATDHPSRYLVHLCQHASKIGHTLRHLHARAAQERPDILDATWIEPPETFA